MPFQLSKFQSLWQVQVERYSFHLQIEKEWGKEQALKVKGIIFRHTRCEMPGRYKVEILKWQVDSGSQIITESKIFADNI
jgi:hypothetical protein